MIIYKGINIVTGKWAYGDIFVHGNQRFILQLDGYVSEVIPDSISVSSEKEYKCQYIDV